MNLSNRTATAAIAVLLFSISSFFAQETEFQVQSITVDPNGDLAIEFPSTDGSYYLLKRGTTVDVTDTGIDGQIGVNGTGTLRDVTVNGINQAFYVIEKISTADPLDMDEDGIDDVFELQRPGFLNPFDPSDATLDFDLDGSSNLKEYQDGTDPAQLPFNAARIISVNPVNGEARVNITREAVVHFDSEMDPTGITEDTFYMQIGGSPLSGRVEVSSTNRFATFFPDEALPTGVQVQVVVDGSAIKDMEGNTVDGDGDNLPGGTSRTVFRTLSNKRIDGTNLWGYVKDSFSGAPLEGAMIYVNAFPNASATTDSEGRFELMDMPAPEFFVHIIGATVSNVPDGFTYPNVGKPFRSVPGQTVQISKDGTPFDIFLPPMALGDTVDLSNTEVTDVGFGEAGKNSLTALFPDIDQGVWDGVTVEIAPGSARDDIGGTFSQAAIIPVPPDRIPEPLPQGLGMPVVISIQAPGATRFDVPAPVTFPNLPDPVTGQVLLPGEKTGLWSFDHDAGLWILQGSMTVSDDGLFLVTDPGVGVSAPGWHGPSNGNSGNGGGGGDGGDDDERDCDNAQQLYNSAATQCAAGLATGVLELEPGVGCAISLSLAAAGASADCELNPDGCGVTVAKNAVAGTLGCIPGAGLIVAGVMCVDGVGGALDNLKGCDPTIGGTPPLDPDDEEELENQAYYEGSWDFPIANLAEPTLGSMFDNQIALIRKGKDLFDAAVGDPIWWAVPEAELNHLRDYLTTIANTMDPGTPGGVDINATEASDLLSMPRPSHLSDAHVEAYIARLNRFSAGGMTDEEKAAIIGTANALKEHAELLDALGWETPYDGFTRGMAALSERRAESISRIKSTTLYYKITNLNNGFIQRGQTNFQGEFSNLILPSNNYFTVEYADPESFKTGSVIFASEAGGSRITIPRTVLIDSVEADSDGDGLNDDLEDIFGSFADNPDSDNDGVLDSEEFGLGSNPLDGVALPTGIVSSLALGQDDFATSLEVVSNRAYVTLSENDLAIVDISDPLLPILVSQLDLPGSAYDVVVDPETQIALVRTIDGFNDDLELEAGGAIFVDVSNPFSPALLGHIPINVVWIFHHDGIFYVSTISSNGAALLNLYHGESLNQLATLDLGGNVGDMVYYQGYLYVAVINDLKVYDLGTPDFPVIAEVPLPGTGFFLGDRRLHAENDVLYVGTSTGYATMDISDPSDPQTLGVPDGTNAGVQEFVSNGSGLLAVAAGNFFSNTIDLYDISEPLNVNQRLNTFATNGSLADIDLNGGLLYLVDSVDGLVIHNYLEFDVQGSAPTVELDLTNWDIDEQTAGIQVTEGSRIFLDAKIRDDFQMRESRWFLNGSLIESNREGHRVFGSYLPRLAAGSSTVTVQVEATDMGGNTGQSEAVTLQLVPDNTPPQVLTTAPKDAGAGSRLTSLQIWLNEAFDPTSVNLAAMSLTRDSNGSVIPIMDFSLTNPQMLVLELEAPLPFDGYQIQMQSGAFADSGGNALVNPLNLAFVSYDTAPGTALWISDEDGEFFDPSNWNFGVLPSRNQSVYIERPGTDPTVTFDNGGFHGSLSIHEAFVFAPSINNMIIQGNWLSTKEGSLNSGRLTIDGTAHFSGPMTIDGVDLSFQQRVEFSSDLTMLSGEFDLSGEMAELILSGNFTPGDIGIVCRNGATFEAPWITSLGSINPNLKLNANDSGSRLSLPNLQTLNPPRSDGPSSNGLMSIQAFSGGVIELPNLETINPGRIQIWSDGDGSVLNLPKVSALAGAEDSHLAQLYVSSTGTVMAGPITQMDYVDLLINGNNSFPIEAISSFTNGRLSFTEISPDLSNLTTLENVTLFANGGSVIEIPGFTSLVLKAGNLIVADGENSIIRFPDLQTLTGSQTNQPTQIWTQSGGTLEFPALTSMNGYFQLRSSGEGSVFDLASLSTLTSTEARKSLFFAGNGGTLTLSNPTITRADFDLTDTGTLSGSTITVSPGSDFNGPGTLSSSLVNQGLITLDRDTGPVIVDGSLNLDTESIVKVTVGLGSDFTGSGKLQSTGAVTLGGTLEIVKRGTYTPQAGDEFEIISFASNTGDFSQITGTNLGNNLTAELEITGTTIKVKVTAP